MHNGIICLNPQVITVLGGVVKSLYEEWQMNQKYSGFSRSSLRVSQESDSGGPPSFEKLQIGASSHWSSEQGRISCQHSKPFPHYHFFRSGPSLNCFKISDYSGIHNHYWTHIYVFS